jgi:hypothetical protein
MGAPLGGHGRAVGRPGAPFKSSRKARPCDSLLNSASTTASSNANSPSTRSPASSGRPHPPGEIVDRLILPLADQAVPEWQATLDALLRLPGIGGPAGYAGGVISIGIRLALAEPRITAAVLFAGSFVPAIVVLQARQVTIPLLVLLQWDDEGNDRQASLDLFDAFGSTEKTLHANLGGHTGVPQFEADDGGRFFARHLK